MTNVKKKKKAKAKPVKAKTVGLPESKRDYGIMSNTEHLKKGGVKRTKNKVAIVGFADSSMAEVEQVWEDPDFEIWPLNQLYMKLPGVVQYATRWFQLHSKKSYDAAARDHKHSEWMALQRSFPIYMQDVDPDIPMSCKFPLQSVMAGCQSEYFTNSISWMIALAIYEEFEEIHIYGVDMAQDDEYTEQRPSVEYFLGYARGKGIKLHVPGNCDLLKAFFLYPFEEDVAFEEKIRTRMAELGGRAANLGAQEQNMRDMRMQLLGARDNMNYIRRNWRGQVKENRMVGDGERIRINLLDDTIIDEKKQLEAELKLKKPPPQPS